MSAVMIYLHFVIVAHRNCLLLFVAFLFILVGTLYLHYSVLDALLSPLETIEELEIDFYLEQGLKSKPDVK
jgi:hypothetical protein